MHYFSLANFTGAKLSLLVMITIHLFLRQKGVCQLFKSNSKFLSIYNIVTDSTTKQVFLNSFLAFQVILSAFSHA
jgi:hypothetical protein